MARNKEGHRERHREGKTNRQSEIRVEKQTHKSQKNGQTDR